MQQSRTNLSAEFGHIGIAQPVVWTCLALLVHQSLPQVGDLQQLVHYHSNAFQSLKHIQILGELLLQASACILALQNGALTVGAHLGISCEAVLIVVIQGSDAVVWRWKGVHKLGRRGGRPEWSGLGTQGLHWPKKDMLCKFSDLPMHQPWPAGGQALWQLYTVCDTHIELRSASECGSIQGFSVKIHLITIIFH